MYELHNILTYFVVSLTFREEQYFSKLIRGWTRTRRLFSASLIIFLNDVEIVICDSVQRIIYEFLYFNKYGNMFSMCTEYSGHIYMYV